MNTLAFRVRLLAVLVLWPEGYVKRSVIQSSKVVRPSNWSAEKIYTAAKVEFGVDHSFPSVKKTLQRLRDLGLVRYRDGTWVAVREEVYAFVQGLDDEVACRVSDRLQDVVSHPAGKYSIEELLRQLGFVGGKK